MALPPFLVGEDLLKFRTRHCERFVKHGRCYFEDKCQYSHDIEWTRRPLWKYNYSPQLCHFVRRIQYLDGREKLQHTCCLRRQCPMAHSREEQAFHPKIYKRVYCERFLRGGCERYYCPFAHGAVELQRAAVADSMSDSILASVPQDVLCPVPTTTLGDVFVQPPKPIEMMSDSTTCSGTPCSTASAFTEENTPCNAGVCPTIHGQTAPTTLDTSEKWIQLTSTVFYNAVGVINHPDSLQCYGNACRLTWYNGFVAETRSFRVDVAELETNDTDSLYAFSALLTSFHSLPHRNVSKVQPLILRGGKHLSKSSASLWCVAEHGLRQFTEEIDMMELNTKAKASPVPPSGFIDAAIAFLHGLQFIHHGGLVHGAITPSAILLDKSYTVRVGGLLMSCALATMDKFLLPPNVLIYCAPEVIRARVDKNGSNVLNTTSTPASDIWSFGICLFYVISNRKHPYGDSIDEILTNMGTNNKVNLLSWASHSPLLYDLLSRMLEPNVSKRITVDEVLQHPVFWKMEETQHFITAFITSFLLSDTIRNDAELRLSTQWLKSLTGLEAMFDPQYNLKTASTDEDKLKVIIQCLCGPEKRTDPLILKTISEQSLAGLICFCYEISRDIKHQITSTLFSQYPSAVLLAHQKLCFESHGFACQSLSETLHQRRALLDQQSSMKIPEYLKVKSFLENENKYMSFPLTKRSPQIWRSEEARIGDCGLLNAGNHFKGLSVSTCLTEPEPSQYPFPSREDCHEIKRLDIPGSCDSHLQNYLPPPSTVAQDVNWNNKIKGVGVNSSVNYEEEHHNFLRSVLAFMVRHLEFRRLVEQRHIPFFQDSET